MGMFGMGMVAHLLVKSSLSLSAIMVAAISVLFALILDFLLG